MPRLLRLPSRPLPKPMTPQEWHDRAIALARSHNQIREIRWIGREGNNWLYVTPFFPRYEEDAIYVTVNQHDFTVKCQCEHGQRGEPCEHAGAAAHSFYHQTNCLIVPQLVICHASLRYALAKAS